MRWPSLTLVLLLAALTIASNGCTPAKAETPRFDRTAAVEITAVAADSLLTLKTRVYLHAGTWSAATDTLRFEWYRNDTLLVTHRSVFTLDSTQVDAPPAGQGATYRGCAQVERGGRTGAIKSTLTCWTWTFTRGFPLPVIDSVTRVVLRSVPLPATAVALADGQTVAGDSNRVQVCAFGVMASGRRVKLKNSWNSSPCELAYQSWLAERNP